MNRSSPTEAGSELARSLAEVVAVLHREEYLGCTVAGIDPRANIGREMRLLFRVTLLALLVAQASVVPAVAAKPQVFEGQIAVASWLSCDGAGCVETTTVVRVGTTTLSDGSTLSTHWLCIRQAPSPLPIGPSSRITACLDGAGTVAADLSSAGASGVIDVLSQSCTHQEVCFPGSQDFLGAEEFVLHWTATAPVEPLTIAERREVERLTREQCTYVTVQTGTKRDAVAGLSFGSATIGALTFAWIGDVTERFVRACHIPPR